MAREIKPLPRSRKSYSGRNWAQTDDIIRDDLLPTKTQNPRKRSVITNVDEQNIHQWGRVTFDLNTEIITWPSGKQTRFQRYATKRLPSDPAPLPKDMFKFGDSWRPTAIRSAVYQVPPKTKASTQPVSAAMGILLTIGAIALTIVILGAL